MTNYKLYDAMIEEAIKHMEKAEATLKKLNMVEEPSTTIEFDTLEEWERYKGDILDAEAERDIFTDLLKVLKEAREFCEYDDLW